MSDESRYELYGLQELEDFAEREPDRAVRAAVSMWLGDLMRNGPPPEDDQHLVPGYPAHEPVVFSWVPGTDVAVTYICVEDARPPYFELYEVESLHLL